MSLKIKLENLPEKLSSINLQGWVETKLNTEVLEIHENSNGSASMSVKPKSPIGKRKFKMTVVREMMGHPFQIERIGNQYVADLVLDKLSTKGIKVIKSSYDIRENVLKIETKSKKLTSLLKPGSRLKLDTGNSILNVIVTPLNRRKLVSYDVDVFVPEKNIVYAKMNCGNNSKKPCVEFMVQLNLTLKILGFDLKQCKTEYFEDHFEIDCSTKEVREKLLLLKKINCFGEIHLYPTWESMKAAFKKRPNEPRQIKDFNHYL